MSESQQIQYADYYVAFLDLLGFKELANSNKSEDKEKIYNYFQLIKETTEELKKIESKNDIGSIIISDSVILSVPKDTDQLQNIKKLRELCIAIQKIQFKLAEMDIWLRGGVSSGNAYFSHSESQVVGPAYINAYLLEERLAIYPRVVLDNKLVKELELDSAQELIDKVNNHESCSSEYSALERNILFQWNFGHGRKSILTQDVALFVDYLVYAFEEESKLNVIMGNIRNSIYLNNGVYSKFRWVTDYLLASCQYHKDHRGCKISGEILKNKQLEIQKL